MKPLLPANRPLGDNVFPTPEIMAATVEAISANVEKVDRLIERRRILGRIKELEEQLVQPEEQKK